MESKGRKLHSKALGAREKGNFKESLSLNDQALFAYDTDNDSHGFAEGLANRSVTLRVYANLHKNSRRILTFAKYEMIGSVEIARESGDKKALAMPLYNLAQLQEDLDEFDAAVKTYREAIDNIINNPPDKHNRLSVVANMKVHMTTCEYKAGDKSALARAEKALKDLENSEEESKYNKDVWVSGGYMRLAHALIDSNKDQANIYLQKAKEIIDSNKDLTLRNEQWQMLAKSF